MIELNGRRLGLDSELSHDYEAFHDGAALVDLSARGRLRFSGAGAKGALNGVLTCDVAALSPGQGAYGMTLTNKGKVIADVTVYVDEDSVLTETSPAAWPAWQQLVAKYINPRLARRTDETGTFSVLGVFGPAAASVTAALTGVELDALDALAAFAHCGASNGLPIRVARIPDLGVDGFRLLFPTVEGDAIRAAAIAAGARAVGDEAVECARIESGRPSWGVEMDDTTIPQEANLDVLGAISFTKGCYTGQEVVARLHFRGHVNRRLVGLRVEGSSAPPRGARVVAADGKESGDVRSAVLSPRFGAIAIGMVRREVAIGDRVGIMVDGRETPAEVTNLPFGG